MVLRWRALCMRENFAISKKVVKAAKSDKLNKDLFVFFRIPQKKDVTKKSTFAAI